MSTPPLKILYAEAAVQIAINLAAGNLSVARRMAEPLLGIEYTQKGVVAHPEKVPDVNKSFDFAEKIVCRAVAMAHNPIYEFAGCLDNGFIMVARVIESKLPRSKLFGRELAHEIYLNRSGLVPEGLSPNEQRTRWAYISRVRDVMENRF